MKVLFCRRGKRRKSEDCWRPFLFLLEDWAIGREGFIHKGRGTEGVS